MTNGEKYKTAQERAKAFEIYCCGKSAVTNETCNLNEDCNECRFAWLDLECDCCTFCVWFEPDSYDFGGKCTHTDITGDNERYCATVYDFNICDKFEKRK